MNRGPRRVYFIKPVGMDGPVKIGCSKSPTGRRDTLQTWAPFPLEIIAEIEGGFDLERRFHSLFADSYLRREWFDWTPEMGGVIADIVAGVFDIASLPEPKRIPRSYLNGKTGPKAGTKWSEQRKAQARVQRAIRQAEKLSGLVRDWGGEATAEQFIADPFKYGVTPDERKRRLDERMARYHIRAVPAQAAA